MIKIIRSFLFLTALTSSIVFANTVYCPDFVVCSNKQCHLSTLDAAWKGDGSFARDGIYKFTSAGEKVGLGTYCVYHVPPENIGDKAYNMFFIAEAQNLKAALNQIGNNWSTSSKYHGCYGNAGGAHSCPFTSP